MCFISVWHLLHARIIQYISSRAEQTTMLRRLLLMCTMFLPDDLKRCAHSGNPTCSSMGAAEVPFACRLMLAAFCWPECGELARCARYCITIFALSVLPAPDSPLTRMACRCSSIIMAENACSPDSLQPLNMPSKKAPRDINVLYGRPARC